MPHVKIDAETTLFYTVAGQGAPLVLLHGFMGTGLSEFTTIRPWLEPHYQLILPDLRGYGQSTPKPRPYGADFYQQDARDIAKLIEHLKLKSVAVLGYSDGGEVALYLPLVSANVQTVVTWGATGHFDESIRSAIVSYLNMRWLTPQISALHGVEHIPLMTQRWVAAMTSIITNGGDISYSRAKEISNPVLMLLGDQDSLNPVVRGQAMADALPKGRLVTFKNTGHAIHAEKPRQFMREVRKFLRQTYRP